MAHPTNDFLYTYAVKSISHKEIEFAGFNSADYDELSAIYNPDKLTVGFNKLKNREEIHSIPDPALDLWINREKI